MVSEWEAEKQRAALPSEMTVAECIERYVSVKESTLSPATIRGYRRMQKNNYARIGSVKIKRLTDEDLQAFISDMCKDHAPKSVYNAYGLLISSVSMFSDRKYHITLPQKKEPERNIPTDDQVSELMSMASPSMKIAIALAAVGTCREGETCALKFKDLNREECTIHVHADMVLNNDNEWIIKDAPKTSAGDRYIQLPQKMIDLFGDGDPEDFIYGRRPNTLRRNFGRLRDKAGLKCRYHDLRAYAASIMHAIGVPDQYIMERSGWKSDKVLKSVYRHTLSDQNKKYQEKANRHFKKLL
jgi:integrase